MKKIVLVIATSLLSLGAQAITCNGAYKGEELFVDFRGGILTIGGETVATFERDDVRINFLRGTMQVANAQGRVTARLTSLTQKTGMISSMSIPARGISATNLPIRCRD